MLRGLKGCVDSDWGIALISFIYFAVCGLFQYYGVQLIMEHFMFNGSRFHENEKAKMHEGLNAGFTILTITVYYFFMKSYIHDRRIKEAKREQKDQDLQIQALSKLLAEVQNNEK